MKLKVNYASGLGKLLTYNEKQFFFSCAGVNAFELFKAKVHSKLSKSTATVPPKEVLLFVYVNFGQITKFLFSALGVQLNK